ncbi:MAG: helix-turn-helix transcriptional regulator [Pseudomonadota bacterium]
MALKELGDQQLESGQRNFDIETLTRIAKALDVDPRELL